MAPENQSEVQIAVFQNETRYGNGNLYKDSLFVYLQPSVNKNSKNLAIFTALQFDDITVKTIYTILLSSSNNVLPSFSFQYLPLCYYT